MPFSEENGAPTIDEVFRDGNLFDELSDGQSQQTTDAGQAAEPTGANTAEGTPTEMPDEAQPRMAQTQNVSANVPPTAQNVSNGADGTAQQQPDASAILNLLIPAFRAMQTENQQLRQSITQQSDDTKTQLEETLEPPKLDIDGMMYADDATRQQKQAEYNNAMLEYQRKMLMKDMQPMVDSYREQQRSQAVDMAINGLRSTPNVGNKFDDVAADIPQIIKTMPALASLPPSEAVSIAALIAKGRAAINAQAKTPDQIAADVSANPEVMKLLELRRAQQLAQNQNIPPMSASQGSMASAPVNVEPQPQTVEEAFDQFSKSLSARMR